MVFILISPAFAEHGARDSGQILQNVAFPPFDGC